MSYGASALEAFPRSWSAQVLATAPMIAPARQYMFPQHVPGEEEAMHRGALYLQVKPAEGSMFLATCALGFRDRSLPSGVWSCPCKDDLLAVAGGYAYRINTSRPERAELMEQRPVTEVYPLPDHALLLLASFHDVLALGAEGVRWRSGRLSWEGVSLGSVDGTSLEGNGWNMFTDTEEPFKLDLRTGQHTGGGYKIA